MKEKDEEKGRSGRYAKKLNAMGDLKMSWRHDFRV